MNFTHRAVVALIAGIALAGRPAAAQVTLTLSSSADLSQLTVGQVVPITVTLTGLPSPNNQTDFIFNLNSKVVFDSTLMTALPDPTSNSGLTATVAPGSAFDNNVQGPLQIANFNAQSSLTAGAATGIFSESPNTNSGAIGLNGVYFTFTLQAADTGSGAISFDTTPGANEYAANDTGFNYAPLNTSSPLNFSILPASTATPEPSSMAAFAFGGLGLMGLTLRTRRKQAEIPEYGASHRSHVRA